MNKSSRSYARLPVFALIAASLYGCIIVPIPWFPEDPLKEDIQVLVQRETVTREDVIEVFGLPWAAWRDSSFIYIKDRPSSYIAGGFYGGGGGIAQMTERDFILQINFDSDGVMAGFERFEDTGDRDYCFSNGICFSQATDNVPLQPQSERNLPRGDGLCTIYCFRDVFKGTRTYRSYVNVFLVREPETPLENSALVGVSVAHGINQWHVEPSSSFEMVLDFSGVKEYPFKVSIKQASRPQAKIRFACEAGNEVYVRLAVPRSPKKAIRFEIVDKFEADLAIRDLPLVLNKYAPDLLEQ